MATTYDVDFSSHLSGGVGTILRAYNDGVGLDAALKKSNSGWGWYTLKPGDTTVRTDIDTELDATGAANGDKVHAIGANIPSTTLRLEKDSTKPGGWKCGF